MGLGRSLLPNYCERVRYLARPCFSGPFLVTHLPTLFLLIGTPLIWLEIFLLGSKPGQTTWLAWFLFTAASVWWWRKNRPHLGGPLKVPPFVRLCLWAGGLFLFVILAVALYASFLPPHLPPEMDALNYHYTLVRQHLVTGNFAHLAWSAADLWLLPIQYALAPFWFSTELPNKFPQFFFLAGVLALSFKAARRLIADPQWKDAGAAAVVFAVAGSHGFAVQFGTAMLDIPLCYLFLAAIDSFLDGDYKLGAVELSFFIWSKPFMPLQVALIAVVLVFFWPRVKPILQKSAAAFIVAGLLIAGPFLAKSFHYTGTPLYPFGEARTEALQNSARAHMGARDAYGQGRSLRAFAEHFWKIAVPANGVNNEFDYPLGLPYLISLAPFLFFMVREVRRGHRPLAAFLAAWWWAVWWMGSQQSRWLYIPLVLMFIFVFSFEAVTGSRAVWASLIVALAITSVSVVRSHKADFGQSRWNVLRPIDKELAALTPADGPVALTDKDAAFARVEVVVTQPSGGWILPVN